MRRIRIIIIASVVALLAAGGVVWFHRSTRVRSSTEALNYNYDVVVVGAGPGGVAASIQAARMGARVALLEPTDWIGGQMTAAGVGNMDEGSLNVRKAGIYSEFIQKAADFYRSKDLSVATCYNGTNSLCIAPHVGQDVLRQMLQQESKKLQVFTGTEVTGVIKHGTLVGGVTSGNKTFTSKVVIDADEYGDVLAQAGAAFRLGNGTDTVPHAKACIQNLTYTAVVKKYAGGVPDKLAFRAAPPGYSPAVANHFKKTIDSMGFKKFIAFRGFPDIANPHSKPDPKTGEGITRASLNQEATNDYPATGSLSTKFVSDPAFRADAICKSKLLTLQLVYYLQHDLGQKDWSIADDEGYDTAYNRQHHCASLKGFEAFEDQMSQEPYVREGRRLIGTETLTGNNLAVSWQQPKNIPTFTDSIALGYYPMDMHECRTANTLEPEFDTASDSPHRFKGGPFEVPLGVVIPKEMDGLLAAEKNISASRLANGAIREQPIAMDIGQATGVLAALAVQRHEQPRTIAASDVQAVLAKDGLAFQITK